VIGSSERPGFTLKMFGSLAHTVALKAPCSVLAVRLTVAPMRSRIPNAQRWRERPVRAVLVEGRAKKQINQRENESV
jgi:hypothetical protein